MQLSLNKQGFITNWLVSGPVCTRYIPPANLPCTWTDQLGYEKALRSVFYTGTADAAPKTIALGQPSPNGKPWQYYYNNKNWFVDTSTFYSLLTAVRLDAATVLVSDCAKEVSAVLWTYGAVDLWLNGQHLCKAQPPVYKPIRRVELVLPLQPGENTLYVRLHNLGVRDTRTLFGLQLAEGNVGVSLPDAVQAAPFVQAEEWLSSLTCRDGVLQAVKAPPFAAAVHAENGFTTAVNAGATQVPANVVKCTVEVQVNGTFLQRRFELLEHIHPVSDLPKENHRQAFYARLAAEKNEPRGNGIYFSVFHVLARYACGTQTQEDEALLLKDLAFIDSRGDCADFLVIGFIRLLHHYPISETLRARIRQSLLNFRYWMDEPGSDGMCFWSENHALMFYGAQMITGSMYPEDTFTNSGRTGKEQAAIGAARCRAWLDDVERDGVEEFNSATYMPVTVTALLNLVDFAPEDISRRASAVVDSLLRQLCLHVFQQSVISPQGRVYRDAIYPYRQSAQTLLHIVDASLPYSCAENIWDVVFATTKYNFPEDLVQIMQQPASLSYLSGNARVCLEKNKDYMLTSVRCPRDTDDAPHWENLCFVEGADKNTNTYVKSLNERFHGTSVFEPGVYGYQQHLWYAALSNQCVVFVNHPGGAVDFDGMRPGYWYGNGVFPAVKQEKNMLGAIYCIPEEHPISFTHTFWPTVKFTQTLQDGHWLFGRLDNRFVGLWCSGVQTPHDDALGQCEYRCEGRSTAYLCLCGSEEEHGSFEEFCTLCKDTAPCYNPQTGLLGAAEHYTLQFTAHENKTQYI